MGKKGNNDEVDWDAVQKAAYANVINDFKEWNDKRKEEAVKAAEVFQNNKLAQLGIKSENLTAMISNTALEDRGSDLFTETVLDLLDILGYRNPDPDCVRFMYNQMQQGYYIAFQADSKKSVGIFYNLLSVISQNSTRIDSIVMPAKTMMRQLKWLRRTQKEQQAEMENEDN